MGDREPEISGHIEISGKGRLDFQGNTDEVMSAILRFLSEIYPAYKVVSDITISLDLEELMRVLKGFVGVSDEGVVILRTDLSADMAIMLCLVGSYVSNRIGKADKSTLTTADIAKLVGKAAKTIRNEMPSLLRKGWIDRVERGEYRATTNGIVQLQDKIRSGF